jgi:hypothetical protein
VAFSALLVLLGAVIAFALGQANRIGDSAHELASSSLHNVVLARDAQAAAQAGATLLHSLFLLRDQQQRIPVYQQIDAYTAARDSAIAELLSTTDSGQFHLAMLEVTRLRDAYVSVFNETVNTVELDDAAARQMMLTETMPALRGMLNALDQLVVLQAVDSRTRCVGHSSRAGVRDRHHSINRHSYCGGCADGPRYRRGQPAELYAANRTRGSRRVNGCSRRNAPRYFGQ